LSISVFTNFIYTVSTHCTLECSEGMVNFAFFWGTQLWWSFSQWLFC